MPRLTITITDEQQEILDQKAGDEGEFESKSEVVRHFIEAGERIEELEQEIERLRRERRQLLDQRREHGELVRYVEDEMERNEKARERRQQPAWTRAWWWLIGEPDS